MMSWPIEFPSVLIPLESLTMAKSKGRNIYLWAVLSLLIGPFAVLIVAVLKTTPTGDTKYN